MESPHGSRALKQRFCEPRAVSIHSLWDALCTSFEEGLEICLPYLGSEVNPPERCPLLRAKEVCCEDCIDTESLFYCKKMPCKLTLRFTHIVVSIHQLATQAWVRCKSEAW